MEILWQELFGRFRLEKSLNENITLTTAGGTETTLIESEMVALRDALNEQIGDKRPNLNKAIGGATARDVGKVFADDHHRNTTIEVIFETVKQSFDEVLADKVRMILQNSLGRGSDDREVVWEDWLGAIKMVDDGYASLALVSDDSDIVLLNKDIPALVEALIEHLRGLTVSTDFREALGKVIGASTPQEVGNALADVTPNRIAWIATIYGILRGQMSASEASKVISEVMYLF